MNPPYTIPDRVTVLKVLALFFALILLEACGPHAVMQAVPRYDISTPHGASQRQSHDRRVLVTTEKLDAASYELLADLDVTKVFYGSRASVVDALADMAREVGADAVIETRVWWQPAGWGWASPQASGRAVALTAVGKEARALEGVQGEWR